MDSNVVVEVIKAVGMVAAAIFGAGGLVVKWLDRKIKQGKRGSYPERIAAGRAKEKTLCPGTGNAQGARTVDVLGN